MWALSSSPAPTSSPASLVLPLSIRFVFSLSLVPAPLASGAPVFLHLPGVTRSSRRNIIGVSLVDDQKPQEPQNQGVGRDPSNLALSHCSPGSARTPMDFTPKPGVLRQFARETWLSHRRGLWPAAPGQTVGRDRGRHCGGWFWLQLKWSHGDQRSWRDVCGRQGQA